MTDASNLPVLVTLGRVSTIGQLASIPEEEIWLQKQKSARTRRAYRLDVQHFMATLRIGTVDELRQADHKAVIAWERYMREIEHAAASTIRRRLAALSSLFRHLIDYGGATRNPAREVTRPAADFNLILQAFPLDGKIVAREITDEDAAGPAPSARGRQEQPRGGQTSRRGGDSGTAP